MIRNLTNSEYLALLEQLSPGVVTEVDRYGYRTPQRLYDMGIWCCPNCSQHLPLEEPRCTRCGETRFLTDGMKVHIPVPKVREAQDDVRQAASHLNRSSKDLVKLAEEIALRSRKMKKQQQVRAVRGLEPKQRRKKIA